eukprot:CAMPEP_0118654524 /NCGR_PEP_ID=MMETSP0785-20121206/12441_1 /TAXON_ID=91992 /ORGANISM="Bolidomonas pacifica, Strain CCMP 1866" /LENGTH=497 /DNA_ID=CAMNT_0006547201 /DNA_START=186 /DNA_END=1675 /DNA_ORIENTATION=+
MASSGGVKVGGEDTLVVNPVGTKGTAREQQYELHTLEQHVALLNRANAPVPPPLMERLEELRLKEQKRTAKRAANRKSACTSRARKKALVDSMTHENQRLQRLSAILDKVPDMIFSVGKAGKISYVNERVTQVLGFEVGSLINGDFYSLLVPPSRPLILHLVGDSSSSSSSNQKNLNVVSTGVSSISSGRSMSPSEGEDSNYGGTTKKHSAPSFAPSSRNQSSNEGSDSSREANSNSLARNVNLFNAKLFPPSNKRGEVDDVNGEGVTANNKTARLSSLEYNNVDTVQKDNSGGENSEGSDSFPTRSDSDENGDKEGERRSVRVCMVRKDLTTVWCEAVFSSDSSDGSDDAASSEKMPQNSLSSATSSSPSVPNCELIFSLRPLRDGEKVGSELAFKPPPKTAPESTHSSLSEDGSNGSSSNHKNGIGRSTANGRATSSSRNGGKRWSSSSTTSSFGSQGLSPGPYDGAGWNESAVEGGRATKRGRFKGAETIVNDG